MNNHLTLPVTTAVFSAFLFLSLPPSALSNDGGLQQKIEALTTKVKILTERINQYEAAEAQVQQNLALMRTADESMNARDWKTFRKVHAKNVYVTSPDSPKPQKDMDVHLSVVKAFTDAFPHHKIQLPL